MLADFHTVNLTSHPVEVCTRDDGSQIVRCTTPLGDYPERLTDRLEQWARERPEQVFIAQRQPDGHWEELSYREALRRVRAIASWLVQQELDAERPIAVLSGNRSEHLLLALAAMYVGIPYAPISPAYSLISSDYGKLKHIFGVLTPGLIFVDELGPFRDALDAVIKDGMQVVALSSEHALDNVSYPVVPYRTLVSTAADAAIDAAHSQVNGDSIAKFLFTSGSTGMPKGVINTQRMLCSNQQMLLSVFPFMTQQPPVLLDWLPWNHTFGGNQNTGIALYNGGSIYIDQGKPVPKGIDVTMNNLADIAPTIYFNVPKGFELLVQKLEERPDIAQKFFSRLQLMYYAGAGLSQYIWDKLHELSIRYTGKKIPVLSGLGSTETAPAALFASLQECRSGVVGTPAPGIEIKLVPNADKLEARIRGVNITPGYWRSPELTEKAFDEEGFYCLGDALKFIDPENPSRGFLFDGRVSEDFKLDTGTWVSVGTLRAQIIHHGAPYVQDVVIAGRDRGYIAVLVFPDVEQCRHLVADSAALTPAELLATASVRERFAELLSTLAQHSTGSSTLVKRLLLLSAPPQIDANEITDKGSINQRAVLGNRPDTVEQLYAEPAAQAVICLQR